jgi:hypothetical protein
VAKQSLYERTAVPMGALLAEIRIAYQRIASVIDPAGSRPDSRRLPNDEAIVG